MRVEEHLAIPVCRTLAGLRIHIGKISLRELINLCYEQRCESIGELVDKMWKIKKYSRGVKEARSIKHLNTNRCSNTEAQDRTLPTVLSG
jgi:hypothetical protein